MTARLPLAVLTWLAAVVAAVALSSAVASGIPASSTAAGSVSIDPSSVTATDSGSMFQTATFAKALGVIRAHLGPAAKLDNLALYPGYLSVIALRGNSGVDATIYVGGRYIEVTTGIAPAGDSLIALDRIRPSAPAAVAQRIAAGAHVPVSQLHYMVAEIDPLSHRLTWLVYTNPGSRVEYFSVPDGHGAPQELIAGGAGGLQPVR